MASPNSDCPICFEGYSSNSDERRVRMLNCGHALCASCLRVQFNYSNGRITCATCRAQHNIRSLEEIPICYMAENLIEEFAAAQRQPQENAMVDRVNVAQHISKCFLTLSARGSRLGRIVIHLNDTYPRRVDQFLTLVSGEGRDGATYRGASFDGGVWSRGRPGERIGCLYYRCGRGDGERSYAALQELETSFPVTPGSEGEVRGYGQQGGFFIVTRGGDTSSWPVIGQVTDGLAILKDIAKKGDAYAKAVTFTDCGRLPQ